MTAATKNHDLDSATHSVHASWQHAKNAWTASSLKDAWRSMNRMLEALPVWAFAVIVVGAVALVAGSSFVAIPFAAVCVFAAVYFTVKRAVLSALREYYTDRS